MQPYSEDQSCFVAIKNKEGEYEQFEVLPGVVLRIRQSELSACQWKFVEDNYGGDFFYKGVPVIFIEDLESEE